MSYRYVYRIVSLIIIISLMIPASMAQAGSERSTVAVSALSMGALDTSFDGDGKVTTNMGNAEDLGYAVAIQSDGKVVVAGQSYNGSDLDFALARYNSNGSLDTTFDGDGRVTTDIGSNDLDDNILDITIQSDGKIVAAGSSDNGNDSDFALARYNSNGSLDATFGSGGKVTTDYGNDANNFSGVAMQSDGKIVAMGSSWVGSNEYIALVRYNSNGSLDTTFDTDGIVTLDFGFGDNRGFDLAIQSDDKIIVVGRGFNGSEYDFVLARYNSNGSLDTTFDGEGKVITDFNNEGDLGFAVTIQPDNKIVVAGFGSSSGQLDIALARYNSNGSLDATFDGDGKVTTDFGGGDDRAIGIALQTDGKIVVTGWINNGADDDIALVRYNSNGSLDTTFDGDGKVTTVFGNGEDRGRDVVIQLDGRIVVAGWSNNGNDFDFALACYNSNGSLDTTFDTNGKVTTNMGNADDLGYAVDIQSDGKVVVAGQSYNGSDLDFALARYNSNGSLDTTFDGDGKVTTDIGNSGLDDNILDIAIQSDGKIVAAGSSDNSNDSDFALARYSSNGSLDATFGSGGKVTTDYGNDANNFSGVAMQSDGKIVAMGSSWVGSNEYIALVRYNSNGSLDTTFDSDGIVTLDFDYGDNRGFDLAIQADGKIVVVGRGFNGSQYDFALARYNSDGSLDTTFDGDGKVSTDFGNTGDLGFAVVIQPDNKIVVSGFSDNGGSIDVALARYNSNGSLDTTFDTDGKVTTDFNGGADRAIGVALQSDGKIVVTGWSNNGVDDDVILARYNDNGSLDTTFDGDGKVTTIFGSGEDRGRDIALQADGRIVVAGWSKNVSDFDLALARYVGKEQTFDDVSTSYWAVPYVESLYNSGITGGCSTNPLNYCPDATVTRAQMAVFLLRGIHGSTYKPPAVGTSTGFGDVPVDYWSATWIKQLVTEGITVGCGNGDYCPEASVTRAQMAVFLLRSKYGSAYKPPAVGTSTGFGDVDTNYWAAAWIKQLVAEGITSGCGSGNYCPETPVSRAQMAVFLVKTFGLP